MEAAVREKTGLRKFPLVWDSNPGLCGWEVKELAGRLQLILVMEGVLGS